MPFSNLTIFLGARVKITVLFFWKIENTTISSWNFLTFMWATTKCSIKSLATSSVKQMVCTICTFIFRISTIIVDNLCWGQRFKCKFFVKNLQNSNKSAFKCLLTDSSDQIMNLWILFSPIFSQIFISWKEKLSYWSKNQNKDVLCDIGGKNWWKQDS